MILCFDFGNTRLKYALFDGTRIEETGFIPDLTWDSVRKLLRSHTISQIAICSVIEIPSDMLTALRATYPVHLIAKEDAHIRFNQYDPSTLGLDRLMLAEACLAEYPQQNCLCLCLGTCITYNVISASGEFIGGAISPGLQMRTNAMAHFTDKLPLISLQADFIPWGKDTHSSLRAGVMAGAKFEMEGFIKDAKDQFADLQIILTGGDAVYFSDRYPVDQDLAWKGLIRLVK